MEMMKSSEVIPYMGMVLVQFAQVAFLVVSKEAIATGITNFTFVFYSNAISSLILLPSSFLIHTSSRSNRPPLTFSILSRFLLLAFIGFLSQVFGYAGIRYASANLASSMLNLIPGFTFILAIIFRMEKVDFRSSSTLAKTIGTLVSVAGAFIVALYKGPAIITNLSLSSLTHNLLTHPSEWMLGGFLLGIDCVFASMFIITQALVLKKYPDELTVMFVYCLIVAILSAITSLIVEKDLSAWNLQPNIRLFAVLYSGLFGSAFQVTIGGWCVKKKGPLFVAMFHPMGIVIASIIGVMFLGDAFYFGSLVGSVVIVIGFYSVMWGKAKEGNMVEPNLESSTNLASEKAPLLQNYVEVKTLQ